MTDNKKIKNATKTKSHNISFKSVLEKRIYEYLLNVNGVINVKYEPCRIEIWDHDKFNVPYFNRVKKRGRKTFQLVTSKPIKVHYSPDFTFSYKDYFVFLEAKGYTNDVFPYKVRLFRDWLENNYKSINDKVCYAVVYSIKDIKELLLWIDNHEKSLAE